MKIIFGIPFGEYARQLRIPENSDQYLRLEQLYNQIQNIQEFVSSSHQVRPIGRETAQLYFEKLQKLGVKDVERDKLIFNVQEIQLFVDTQIEKAKATEKELLIELEKIVASLAV